MDPVATSGVGAFSTADEGGAMLVVMGFPVDAAFAIVEEVPADTPQETSSLEGSFLSGAICLVEPFDVVAPSTEEALGASWAVVAEGEVVSEAEASPVGLEVDVSPAFPVSVVVPFSIVGAV